MIWKFGKTRYGFTKTATSGGTLILPANCSQFQVFTGALNHNARLPNATLTSNGEGIQITIINSSTGTITVQYNDGSTISTINAGESKEFLLVDDSTSNGVWGVVSFSGVSGKGIGSVEPGALINSNYNVQASDSGRVLNIDSSGGAITVNLPAPSSNFLITVKDYTGSSATNNITIVRSGSEKIDDYQENKPIFTNFRAVSLISNGTDWFSVGDFVV